MLFDLGYVGPAVAVRAVGRRADFIERGLVTKFAAGVTGGFGFGFRFALAASAFFAFMRVLGRG
ncbi:hypothetical protein [Paraburkholderia terricola]|uniref:hypothetical protein n=1 Tax=Paraburkholderia terricola TaxID=169427 RepID=UPI000DEFE6DC|nr:hypothetical protein [Paraburkholderia terricola]AXE94877.1 hypothetical protein CUJ90_21185 [Paraburkholderia terricola]